MGGVPREQKMLKGHLPIVIYHQVYNITKYTTYTKIMGPANADDVRFRGIVTS